MTDHTSHLPRVSVVMGTYNGAKYIEAQLDSILAQDLPPCEIIIQDDGSQDDTVDIAESYRRQHPQIRLVRNERRLGFNGNFATALRRATGDFVAIADQDDIWFPQKLRRQVEAIGEADLCFSAYYRDETFTRAADCRVKVCPAGTFESLLFANTIPGRTMLLRRSFLQRPDVVSSRFYYDWWFLVQAHLSGSVVRVDEALNWHRPHADSAIAVLHRADRGGAPARRATWQPYVCGWADLMRLRREPVWQSFYGYIYAHTAADARFRLVHQLCATLLGRQGGVLRLCCLCLYHRGLLYPSKGEPGWKNRVRAFCLPAIYAYRNAEFKSEKFQTP